MPLFINEDFPVITWKRIIGGKVPEGLEVIEDEEPTLEDIRSQLVTERQFNSPLYLKWCKEMKEKVRYHRKQWELVYTLQALDRVGLLREGRRGLGFGVGKEPLPAVMAKFGCRILATEINIESPHGAGWVTNTTVEQELNRLNDRRICNPKAFRSRVQYRDVDMNHIPQDLVGFDFVWSCCSLEHVGSLGLATDFIFKSLECLKPGGVAVHTTEFNVFPAIFTVTKGSTVFFRRKDILKLSERLLSAGHTLSINFHGGRGALDRHIDFPPHSEDKHLKLFVTKRGRMIVATSIGLIIRKAKREHART